MVKMPDITNDENTDTTNYEEVVTTSNYEGANSVSNKNTNTNNKDSEYEGRFYNLYFIDMIVNLN